MNNAIGVIINNYNQKDLGLMASHRSTHTVPIGGKYRLIDFSLSNLVNANIRKIGIVGSNRYRSLVDHLGSGAEWNLSNKSSDLAILHGGKNAKIGEVTRINLQDFLDNRGFITRVLPTIEHVAIFGCNIVSNVDVDDVLNYHVKNNADVTMIYKDDYDHSNNKEALLDIDENNKINNIISDNHDEQQSNNAFIDMLIIKKKLLLDILDLATESGEYDLIDVITQNINNLNVIGYKYEGYIKIINSIKAYFDCSMEMLQPEIQKQIFHSNNRIFTKAKDNHPTKYGKSAVIRNSLIASGAKIYGTVENSIIFRGVTIEPSAKVKNCIVMENTRIGLDTVVVNTIVDRNVTITENKILVGTNEKPLIIRKDAVL